MGPGQNYPRRSTRRGFPAVKSTAPVRPLNKALHQAPAANHEANPIRLCVFTQQGSGERIPQFFGHNRCTLGSGKVRWTLWGRTQAIGLTLLRYISPSVNTGKCIEPIMVIDLPTSKACRRC